MAFAQPLLARNLYNTNRLIAFPELPQHVQRSGDGPQRSGIAQLWWRLAE